MWQLEPGGHNFLSFDCCQWQINKRSFVLVSLLVWVFNFLPPLRVYSWTLKKKKKRSHVLDFQTRVKKIEKKIEKLPELAQNRSAW